MRNHKLLRRFFFTAGLFSFVFPILIGISFSWWYYHEQIKAAKSFIKERNEAVSWFIDGYFKEIRNTVRILASLPEIAEIPWQDEATKQRILALFKTLQQFNPNIYYIYSGYIDGSLFINDYEPPPGFDPRNRPWYRAVMESPKIGNEVVGLLYEEAKTKELLLATVRILKSQKRGFTGAVSIDSFTQEISKQIERKSNIYQSTKNLIINHDGTILIHPSPDYIGKKLTDVVQIDQFPLTPGQYFTYKQNSQRHIAYLSEIPTTNWRLITIVDESEIVKPIIDRLVLYSIGITALSLLFGVILTLIWKYRVTAPLIAVSDRMKRIADAENMLSTLTKKTDNDEISEIVSNIENITIQTLVQKNKELSQANKTIEKMNQELSLKNAMLERLATVDSLTGILNRRKIEEQLNRECERYRRHEKPFSIILFDIDHFKSINDTFGHQTGDLVLKELAQNIANRLRSTDFLGRWGGEEFLILLPDTQLKDAVILANHLSNQVAHHPFPISRQVTISIGVGEIHHGETLDQLISRVDGYLYRAKSSGRNRVISENGSGQ